MTNREFYNAVVANEISEEVIAHATNALAKLDERNAKRANTPSKTQIANEPMLASEIANAVGISTPKASALAKKVDGVQVTDVKVKGKGTQKGYYL